MISFVFKLVAIILLLHTLLLSDSLNQNKRNNIYSTFSDKEIAWLKKKQTVTYVYDPDWAPFEWKNSNNYHC